MKYYKSPFGSLYKVVADDEWYWCAVQPGRRSEWSRYNSNTTWTKWMSLTVLKVKEISYEDMVLELL